MIDGEPLIHGFTFDLEGATITPDSQELAAAIVDAIHKELLASLAKGITFGSNLYDPRPEERYEFG